MSDRELARRADTQIVFGGEDITVFVNKGWMSFTYTDNEEDEADDLQIKAYDREGKWLRKWLNNLVDNAAQGGDVISSPPDDDNNNTSSSANGAGTSSSSGSSANSSGDKRYKVTASTGVNIRSGAGEKYKILGKLPYGTVVEVSSFSGSWAKITYSGRTGYIKKDNLKLVGTGGSSSSGTTSSGTGASSGGTVYAASGGGSGGWNIGDDVIANGAPWGDSYGSTHQGWVVKDHKGKVTYLNLKPGVPYPICVDALGWYAESAVRKIGDDDKQNNVGESDATGKGLKISAVITLCNGNSDGKDSVLDCGQFELDDIDVQGPPATVTIKATSLPYNSTIRQTLKSKSWENITLSGITKEIAGKNSMGVLYESTADPKYVRVEQYQMSDIAFLQKLCHDAGCSLKATNNIIVVFDQAQYESKAAVRTIKFGKEGEYIKYRLSTNANNCYTSCRVYYTTPDGTVISATEYAENYGENSGKQQCLEVNQKVADTDEAQKLAHKLLRLHNKFENSATFTLPGDTRLAAGVTVELVDFGFGDGKYIIKQARHSISSSGYTTQITLRKCLADNEKESDGAPAQDSSAMSDEELDQLAYEVAILGKWDVYPKRKELLEAAGYDYNAVQGRVEKNYYGGK